MPSVQFVTQLRYYDADGVLKVGEGEDANRVIQFPSTWIGTKDDASSPKRYTFTDRVAPASAADLSTLTTRVTNAENAAAALAIRVTALETKRFIETAQKTTSYTAVAWEHVLVDMGSASGDVTITMPTSPAPTIGDRVRVTDVAVDGGAGAGYSLKVACTFASAVSVGHWATSPHSVAYSVVESGSLRGASIELVYVGTGWFVVEETCQITALL